MGEEEQSINEIITNVEAHHRHPRHPLFILTFDITNGSVALPILLN